MSRCILKLKKSNLPILALILLILGVFITFIQFRYSESINQHTLRGICLLCIQLFIYSFDFLLIVFSLTSISFFVDSKKLKRIRSKFTIFPSFTEERVKILIWKPYIKISEIKINGSWQYKLHALRAGTGILCDEESNIECQFNKKYSLDLNVDIDTAIFVEYKIDDEKFLQLKIDPKEPIPGWIEVTLTQQIFRIFCLENTFRIEG